MPSRIPDGLKLTAQIALGLLLAFGAYYGYWKYQYHRAESEAQAFCSAATPGSDISATIARANAQAGLRHGFQEKDTRYVAVFRGPIFNAFTCELTVANAKVTSARVVEPVD